MNRILSSLSIMAVAVPAMAFAAEGTYAYPRLSGDSSDNQVQYAPGARANVAGGGVAVFTGTNDQVPVFAYGPRAALSNAGAGTPVFVGVDDGRPVFAYLPTGQSGSALADGGAHSPRG